MNAQIGYTEGASKGGLRLASLIASNYELVALFDGED